VSGGRLVNFVAVIEQDTWTRESWTDRGDPADALAAFAGWHPQVRAILEAVDETFIWALFDHIPLEHWSAGRVTLLGDACHAMLPFMAQGAAQAIEDAATLASCLASAGSDPTSALHRYENLRIPRASRIQAMSTANKKRFHLADGPEQRERDTEMSAGSTDWSFGAVAWIYEHDASGVVLPAPGSSPDQLLVQVRVPCRHHGGREPAGGLLTALSRVDPAGRLDQRREIVR
jgi:salicylate hydroxylase